MNITGKIKHLMMWIGIVAYLVLTLTGMNNLVFCHEANGTVSLEKSINGVCNDFLQEVNFNDAEQVMIAFQHKHCIDQPVDVTGLLPQSHSDFDSINFVYDIPRVSHHLVTMGYLATVPTTLLAQPPPGKPVLHRYLKSVILLI